MPGSAYASLEPEDAPSTVHTPLYGAIMELGVNVAGFRQSHFNREGDWFRHATICGKSILRNRRCERFTSSRIQVLAGYNCYSTCVWGCRICSPIPLCI